MWTWMKKRTTTFCHWDSVSVERNIKHIIALSKAYLYDSAPVHTKEIAQAEQTDDRDYSPVR